MKKSIFAYLVLVVLLVAANKSDAQSPAPSETTEKTHHKHHSSDKRHGHGKGTRHFLKKHHSERGGHYHSHHQHDHERHRSKDQPVGKPDNK